MNLLLKRVLVAGIALTLLSACAEVLQRQEAREVHDREQYLRYAGPPIEQYTSLIANYRRWSLIGDDQVVVWTDYEHAYVLKVQLPCPELRFADALGVTSSSHTVTRGFDSVQVAHQLCRITEIRPVDYARMKQDLHTAS